MEESITEDYKLLINVDKSYLLVGISGNLRSISGFCFCFLSRIPFIIFLVGICSRYSFREFILTISS